MHKFSKSFITCLALFFACTLVSTPKAAAATNLFSPRKLLSGHTNNSSDISDNATGLFTVKTIFPGSTMTLSMEQTAAFPLGCPQLFILAAGSGTLTITLQKNDISGDAIFMLGLSTSGSGTIPLFRTGVSKGLITQSVVLGSDSQPYGFVWLYCGVFYSAITPAYSYTIQLSFEP